LAGIVSITNPPLVPVLAGAFVVAIPFAFALLALIKAKALTGKVASSLDSAWTGAAHDVADRRHVLRVPELVEDLKIDKDYAHKLISQLASHDDVKTEITDEGELALSVRADRVRVAQEANSPAVVEEAAVEEGETQSRSEA